jgi:peptide/nickel transport system substrate-binding protein
MTMDLHKRLRFGLAVSLACALALGAAACAPAPSGQQGEATIAPATTAQATGAAVSKVPADTIVEAIIGEPESLDPAWTYETTGSGIESNIYDTLVYFNREKPDDFVPNLATEYKVSDDGLTYTFNIRPGVKFHNGGTLEAHDVAYTIQRALLQNRADGPMWLFLDPFFNTSSIETLVFDQAGMKESASGEKPKIEDAPADALAAVCKTVQDAVVADDAAGTVTLKLAKATPWFLQLVSQPWVAALDKEWQVEQGDWDGDCANWLKWHNPAAEKSVLFDKANGTGPYKLVEWKKGEAINLEANADYWRTEPAWPGGPVGPAKVKNVVLQKVPEWGTRLTKLQTGEADIADVPRANIDQVKDIVSTEYMGGDESAPATVLNEQGLLKLFRGYPSVSANVAIINHKLSDTGGNEFIGSGKLDGQGIPVDFFSDLDVRKAFNYCFDWDTFIKDALLGEGFQTRGPIIKGLQGYTETNQIYTYDLAKCKESIEKAWGGKVKENGFKMTIAYNEGNEARKTAAEILAASFSQIDPKYKIDVIKLEWPTFLDSMRQAKLPIGFAGWLEDYHDASNWVHPFMNTEGAYAGNQGFAPELQKKFDDLMAQGVKETDPAKRVEIYTQLQNLAMENAIDIFLFQATGRTYMNKDISGWFYNPLAPGHYYYPLVKGAQASQ